MADVRLMVAGASGRMGRTLIHAIAEIPGVALSGALEAAGHASLGQDSGILAGLPANGILISDKAEDLVAASDVVVDFTRPHVTMALSAHAVKHGKAHIIGTTGFSPEQEADLAKAAEKIVIVKSGNMSMGVAVLTALVKKAAAVLADFDAEILEMHHNKKVDAPSGTALMLGRAVAEGRGVKLEEHMDRGRDGETGARKAGDIGFASLRGGTVVGEHEVIFAGPRERVILSHSAEDRAIFANGAVKCALWTAGKPAGLYSIHDVLGLKD